VKSLRTELAEGSICPICGKAVRWMRQGEKNGRFYKAYIHMLLPLRARGRGVRWRIREGLEIKREKNACFAWDEPKPAASVKIACRRRKPGHAEAG